MLAHYSVTRNSQKHEHGDMWATVYETHRTAKHCIAKSMTVSLHYILGDVIV